MEGEKNKQINETEQEKGYQLRDHKILKTSNKYCWKDFLSLIAESGEPSNYEEATTNNEATNWIKTIDEEINSLKKMKHDTNKSTSKTGGTTH